MKNFGANGYLLRDARLDVRLVYTGFLVLAAIGMLSVAAFQLVHIGPTPEAVATYYRGGTRGMTMVFPKDFRQLVEVTHFHAFVMGLVYVVLAHLFLATSVSERVKRTAVVAGFAGLAGDLVGVWLVRYVAAGFAYLQVVFWLLEWVGFAAFVYCPVREMWFTRARDGLHEE